MAEAAMQTPAIVRAIAQSQPRVRLLDNPRKLQAAALNLVVARFGDGFDCVIRIDAHGDYPEDYCDRLIEEFIATGADIRDSLDDHAGREAVPEGHPPSRRTRRSAMAAPGTAPVPSATGPIMATTR
jgi:hypothetical protein